MFTFKAIRNRMCYKPMVELFDVLLKNDFTVYINRIGWLSKQ